jgi:hypothetical protein
MAILDLVFLVTMGAFAILAPCGDWENSVLGVTLWHNGDPGGPYVISAVHFLDPGYPPFVVGHPGTTLQLVLHLSARLVHRAAEALSGTTPPFLAFWVQHITWLFALSSIVVAALHVASFHALRAYARRLGLSDHSSLVAMVAYATCFPILYYGGRVSPEPILVTLTLVALLQADSSGRALASGRRLQGCLWASGAAATAMLALFTKLHLAYPLVPIILVQLLTQRPGPGACGARRYTDRLLAASPALVSAAVVFVACSLKVDWNSFFGFWFHYTPGRPASDARLELWQSSAANLAPMARAAAGAVVANLRDHFRPTASGLFVVSEGLFGLVACFGLVRLWRRVPAVRSKLVWSLALCAALLPVVAFRGLFHYYVIHMAFAAIGFACALDMGLARPLAWRALPLAHQAGQRPILVTLLVHSGALVFFLAARAHDVSTFRSSVEPYLQALNRLPLGTRAVVVSKRFEFWQLDGGYPNYIDRARVGFTRAFEARAHIVRRAHWITPELVDREHISSVIDASSGTVRSVPVEQWQFVAAPATP